MRSLGKKILISWEMLYLKLYFILALFGNKQMSFKDETKYLALSLVLFSIKNNKIRPSNSLLITLCAINISSKYFENNIFSFKHIHDITQYCYTNTELLEVENIC